MAKRLSLLTVLFVLITITSCTTSNPTAPGGGGQGPSFDKGIFVLNGNSKMISFLNLENDSVNFEFTGTGDAPNDMLYLNDKLYVINSLSHSMATYTRTDSGLTYNSSTDLGATNNPYDIASDGGKLFVTCFVSNEVVIIDPSSKVILDRIDVGLSPEGIIYLNGFIYVACTGMDTLYNFGDGYIYKINTSNYEIVDSCKVGVNAQFLINVNNDLHITCTGNYSSIFGKMYIVGTQDSLFVKDSLDVGGSPGRLCYDGSETVYIASGGWVTDGQVFSYNINGTIIHGSGNPIRTPAGAMDVGFYDNSLFVACNIADSIAELQGDSVVKTWSIGDGPVKLMIW